MTRNANTQKRLNSSINLIRARLASLRTANPDSTPEHNAAMNLIRTLDPAQIQSAPDPYWPKWTAPWWTFSMISEEGLTDQIPRNTLLAFTDSIDRHMLHHFPLTESDIPPECNPYRQIICFCALGTICRILAEASIAVEDRYPWMLEWFARYQLQDGGWNCDEAEYVRTSPRSSVLSTVTMMEALIAMIRLRREHRTIEMGILRRAIEYLTAHRLIRRLSGEVIHSDWLIPVYPSFYFYDILRGLSALVNACEVTGTPLPAELVAEGLDTLSGILHEEFNHRNDHAVQGTLILTDTDWTWKKTPESREDLDRMTASPHMIHRTLSRIDSLLSRLESMVAIASPETPASDSVGITLEHISWLPGTWLAYDEKTVTTETWKIVSAGTYEGIGETRSAVNQQLVNAESLRLVEMSGEVFYLAKVTHNEHPVPFKLIEWSDTCAVFANPSHDFPKRLEYRLAAPDQMIVRVSDGNEKGFTLKFQRA